ncbi:MAG: MBL fold metallo-hydrolase [Sterolibacteriaceae bacterium]|uniref:MBL fold metallo-hydrolase n=1 Tax=Sulfuritalea sp. TaxID=2480090 RepID=UPI001A4BA279|nr:MBL fold metallo-hydrolase [Sulfuritalea sp.]MBL8478313.1 MBL fold metallo-hydrolase [Sterolibacteriaceae bacterium]MBN8475127.1 MBL fold metallo-hydrolase [Sulfuritalea sp.]
MKLPDSIQVIERGWLSSNNILLYAGESATLVDAGYVGHAPQTVELVTSALAARRPATRLDLLVNTHSHSDHIGGNASLQAAFGCKIAIPAGIERMVAEWDTDALMLDAARQRGDRFAHDAVIEADSEFEIGGLAWQALAAPGHDMEALIYYCAEKRLLISGDALWQDGFGIIFGEVMGRKDALPATRSTLEMIGRLDVDIVIPGHGAPFDDFDGAMARALRRLESFEADSTRVGRNAVRACFTFNLLDLQRLREDELAAYLASVPFFHNVNQRMLGFSDDDFASWLLGELLRSRSVELKDGWILPTMAP